MRKPKVKILISAFMVSTIVLCSAFGLRTNAATTKPSVVTLETLLNDRTWVLDTIVKGDYTTHPLNSIDTVLVESFDDYAEYSYTKINEDPKMRAFIRVADFLYNGGDYITDWLWNENWSTIREMGANLNVSVPESMPEDQDEVTAVFQTIADAFNTISKTRTEKYYDDILKKMFNTEYDSEYYSIDDEEIFISEIRNLFGIANKISSVEGTLSSYINWANDAVASDQAWYINNFLPDYKDSITDYLNEFSEEIERAACLSGEYTVEDLQELEKWTDTTQLISIYQSYETDNNNLINWTNSVQAQTVLNKASDVLTAIGKTTDFVNSIYENYVLLEALQYQKESSIDVINRLFNNTSDGKLRLSLSSIYGLMNTEYTNLTSLYCSTMNVIENQDIIHDLGEKTVKKIANNIIIKRNNMKLAKFCSSVASASALLDVGLTLADKCTGIEETASKYYEIGLALDLIDDMRTVYDNDLAAYYANKTEENAQKVLDDILFLKKARLCVTKLVYDSGAAQVGSWIFQIFADDATEQQWERDYQSQLDVLLSATISPIYSSPMVVSADRMLINTSADYASIYKDGKYHYVIEISKRCLNGLIFEGQSLSLSGGGSFYSSTLQVNNVGSVIINEGTSVYCDCFYQEGSTSLGINNALLHVNSDLEISDLTIGGNNANISVGNLNAGTLYLDAGIEINVMTIGRADNVSGGKITLTGDAKDFIYIDNLYLIGNGNLQTLCNGSVASLIIEKSSGNVKIKEDSMFLVYSRIRKNIKIIENSKNIYLTDSAIVDGAFRGDLSANNWTCSQETVINGNFYAFNGTTINSKLTVNESFYSESCSALNGTLIIADDATVDFDSFGDNSIIDIKGDASLNSYSTLGTLLLSGAFKQSIFSESFSVKNLIIDNPVFYAVTFDGPIHIYNSFTFPTKRINNSDNLIFHYLPSNTRKLPSDIKFGDLTVSQDAYVNGNMNIIGEIRVNSSLLTVNGSVSVSPNASLNIVSGAEMSILGCADFCGNLNIDGILSVKDDAKLSSDVSGDGELICGSDFEFYSTVSIEPKLVFSENNSHHISGGFDVTALEILGGTKGKVIFDASVSVQTLTIADRPIGSIDINSQIDVFERFNNNAKRINGKENIILHYSNGLDTEQLKGNIVINDINIDNSETFYGNVTLGSVTISEDIFVNGNATITGGVTITGGSVYITGNLTLTENSSLTISNDSSLTANGNLSGYFVGVSVDGTLSVKDDFYCNYSSISGSGKIEVGGDFVLSYSLEDEQNYTFGELVFNGITAQYYQGDDCISFGSIILNNSSDRGVTFESNAYYRNEFLVNSTVVKNASNVQKV